jgi:hypothetical protein
MSLATVGRRAALAAAGLAMCLACGPDPAWAASGLTLCVPRSEGSALLTPRHGACKRGYKLTAIGAEGREGKPGREGAQGSPGGEGRPGPEGKVGLEGEPGPEGRAGFTGEEVAELRALLPYVSFVAHGAGGEPTIEFSGVNVQIVNGAGITESTNGVGNLVIGYDEDLDDTHAQTGSHDLILGDEQTFTGYAGIVAGRENQITAPFASVLGGTENKASGPESTVAGGGGNAASGTLSAIFGGKENKAKEPYEALP